MKKFVRIALGTAALIYGLKAYDEYKAKYQEQLIQQAIEDMTTDNDQAIIYVAPTEEPITLVNDYTEAIDYNYVNYEVYNSMIQAKDNFTWLYSGGEVSSQMRNWGITLGQGDVEIIDSNMRYLFSLISQYVDSYRKGDYVSCNKIGKELSRQKVLSREYLYDVLVSRKLPTEFKGTIASYDNNGNIQTINGRLIHLIGGQDPLVKLDNPYQDEYTYMLNQCEWIENLPNVLLNEYSVVKNSRGNDGICYIWNQTAVEKDCRNEWEAIRNEGHNLYGFNQDTVFVIWDYDLASYVYVDQSDVRYPLDANSSTRVDHLMEVQDSMVGKEGDVLFLDSYIKNMRAYNQTYQYSK